MIPWCLIQTQKKMSIESLHRQLFHWHNISLAIMAFARDSNGRAVNAYLRFELFLFRFQGCNFFLICFGCHNFLKAQCVMLINEKNSWRQKGQAVQQSFGQARHLQSKHNILKLGAQEHGETRAYAHTTGKIWNRAISMIDDKPTFFTFGWYTRPARMASASSSASAIDSASNVVN